MKKSLEKIINWVKEHSPQTLEHLNPSATIEEIDAIEKSTGLPIPDSLKEFLQIHNGEDGMSWLAILGDGNQLLSCQAIIAQYQMDQEIGQQMYDPQMATMEFWKDRVSSNVIAVKGAVKPLMLHPNWLPLTCMNGDVFRFLDFDPAPGGKDGQVIEVDPEGCSYQVLADSFTDLLVIYAEQLEKGKFKVAEDGFIERIDESDILGWGIPGWLK